MGCVLLLGLLGGFEGMDLQPGGDCSTVADQLVNIVQVHSTTRSFAALSAEGKVVTWGTPAAFGLELRVFQTQHRLKHQHNIPTLQKHHKIKTALQNRQQHQHNRLNHANPTSQIIMFWTKRPKIQPFHAFYGPRCQKHRWRQLCALRRP